MKAENFVLKMLVFLSTADRGGFLLLKQVRDKLDTGERHTQLTDRSASNDWRKKPRRGKKRLPIKPLDEILDPLICWLGIAEAERQLLCDRTQIYRDLKELKKVDEALRKRGYCLLGLDKRPKEVGLSRETFEVLFEFRKLVQQRGKDRAIDQIPFTMQEIYERRYSRQSR